MVIKEEKLAEVMSDFYDAMEAACVNAKRQIAGIFGVSATTDLTQLPFDVSKIKWQDQENEKGKFQKSEDVNSPDHRELLKFLNEHVPSKCVTSQGFFYWIYGNGSTIGRKPRK